MCKSETLGTQITFHHANRSELVPNKYQSGDFVRVFLDGETLGVFNRSIVNPLRRLLCVGNRGGHVWTALSDETRHLIHAEDRGEYVLLWLNDFTGKKPTRREATLIKA